MKSPVSPVFAAILAASLSMTGTLASAQTDAPVAAPVTPATTPAVTPVATPASSTSDNPLSPELVNAAGKDALAPAAAPVKSGKSTKAVKAGKPATAAILRAQVLLDRAHFGAGEIDGATGSNMKAALTGFQKARGIDGDGTLNAATWEALNADASDALITHTLTAADVAGPFQPIPEDMAAKAKLTSLGYASVEEALGERFHASPALLKRLNPGKDFTKAGEQIVVPNVEGAAPLPKGGKIVVSKAARTLTLYDTAGKVVAQFPSSTGSDKDPLPLGEWKVNGISKNPVFWYNPKLFWDAKPGESKAKIPAGPNNPVGVAWIDLSKEHYGIHGTPVPGSIGKTQSHGCIRLTNWDVSTLMTSVGAGTQVVLEE
ncbi:MAG TPA: L,D-transpeptidase family protein [Telluria sp.]|nr:L,D-transpeptidase family protein [Telluria sp.]